MYLFDIDGTLLLSGGAGRIAINQLFVESYGVSGAMDSVQPGGKTDEIIFQECAEVTLGRSLEKAELSELLVRYVPRLEDELEKSEGFHLMPEVVSCLEYLSVREPYLGIATGNLAAAAEAKLRRGNLHGYFHFGGYASDSAIRSELVAKAMKRGRALMGPLRNEEFIVVGDTLRDIEAARMCGARVIAVATGHVPKEQLLGHNPDVVLDTLGQLPAWHQTYR